MWKSELFVVTNPHGIISVSSENYFSRRQTGVIDIFILSELEMLIKYFVETYTPMI